MDTGNFITGVINGDSRGIVTSLETFPFSSVATVDSQFDNNIRSNSIGTGSFITPNHILTAGHVVFDPRRNNPLPSAVRATPSTNQGTLNSRIIGNQGDPPLNVSPHDVNYLLNFDQVSGSVRGLIPFNQDIALLTNNGPALDPEDSIGIITFVDPKSVRGLNIRTAGFPADGRTIGDNTSGSRLNGRTLVESPKMGLGQSPDNPDSGTIKEVGDVTQNPRNPQEVVNLDRILYFSFDIDIEAGQSGGPVWHILAGDTQPRLMGIITGALTSNPISLGLEFGTVGILITTDVYDSIMMELEEYGWGTMGNVLPENAIVGSDGDDLIVGSFRRERIMGVGGENLLFGGGGDDRLEGTPGLDFALFAEPVENYTIIKDLENGGFIVEHTGGSQTEGRNLLTNIELAVFNYDAKASPDIQDNLYFLPLDFEVNPDVLNNLSLRFPSMERIGDFILSPDIYNPPIPEDVLIESPTVSEPPMDTPVVEAIPESVFDDNAVPVANPMESIFSFEAFLRDRPRMGIGDVNNENVSMLPNQNPIAGFVPSNSIFSSAFNGNR